jgi:hypothetical protein
VDGVWASSAPLHAEVDFFKYKETMTKSIASVGGEQCGKIIKNAFKLMEDEVTARQTSRINSAFRLCLPIDLTVDVPHLFYELSDIVAGLVQGHRVGDIERACQYMMNSKAASGNDDLDAFAAWVKHNKILCIDMSYKNSVRKFSNVEWGSEAK